MRVVVFGSINVDTTLRVSRRPRWGETVLAGDALVAAGGKGANQAAAAALLGSEPVFMVGRVGRDANGGYARRELEHAGVVDRVVVDEHATTGCAFIVGGRGGRNSIVVASGANARTTLDDLVALEEPWAATVLVLQLEVPVEAGAAAARLARERGWHVVLNTAPVRQLPAGFLESADTLVANEVETAQLTGRAVRDVPGAILAGRALRKLGPSRVAVTLGEQGAVLVSGARVLQAPAPRVAVVDTTAAGDAFVGCLAASIAEGCPDDVALGRAVAAGSLTTTRAGAQPSIPRRKEMLGLAAAIDVRDVTSTVPASSRP